MTTPVTLRGRAASPVRPGLVTKQVLLGIIPLATGELVTEASITDLHNAYKEQIRRENALRPRAKRLRGMTSYSFKTIFKFAQLLGLVELVREEPMQFPPPGGPLYSVRVTDKPRAVISTRRIFKISDLGKEDEKSWTNLAKAWIEGWSAPQKAEYIAPLPREEVEPIVREEIITAVVPIKWVARPSEKQYKLLLAHLKVLQKIGIDDPDVKREVDRLSMLIGDWVIEVEDMLEDAKSINFAEAINKYTDMLRIVGEISEALGDQELGRAIESLKELS